MGIDEWDQEWREPICHYCKTPASKDKRVKQDAKAEGCTPAEIAMEDGTYNVKTNEYACDGCYIKAGMPGSATGWRVPG